MPKFRTGRTPFWDGVHLHKPGTAIEIDREDYGRLLNPYFVPLDAQAKRDMTAFRAKIEKSIGRAFNPVTEEYGNLDPNKPKDLEKLAPRGARPIPEQGVEVEEEVVVPETSTRSQQE